MKGEIVYIDQTSNIIHLYIRGEDGEKYKLTIGNFRPYFYIPAKDSDILSLEGRPVKKVVVNEPGDVKKVRERYKMHYEADIRYTQRFLIDKDIYCGVEFDPTDPESIRPCEDISVDKHICYLDIEVSRSEEISCVTIYSNYLEKYVTFLQRSDLEEKVYQKSEDWIVYQTNSEKKLLLRLISVLDELDIDILAGYYLTEFDYPVIEQRLAKHNLYLNRRFDLFDIYKGFYTVTNGRRESYHLKDVAVQEGYITQEEVLEYDENWWEKDLETLLIYNRRDVEWIVQLDSDYSIIEHFDQRKKITGIAYYYDPHSDLTIYNITPPIDILCLREAYKINVALPSKSKTEKKGYRGGYVYLKAPGIYKDLANFDFSQYYPSIILSFKLDPLILSNYYKKYRVFSIEKYVRFAEDWIAQRKPTILLNVVKKLQMIRAQVDAEIEKTEPGTKKRKELENKKQAVKGLVNGVYGALGHPGFRLSYYELANSVTSLGREGITYLRDEVQNRYGYDVIYMDTDSLYIQMPFEEAEKMTGALTKLTNEYFANKYGVKTKIKMKFEKYCSVGFFEAKKHYSVRVIWEGKECDYVDIKGSEAIRRDESKFTRALLKEFYDIVLRGNIKRLPSWYKEKVNQFMNSSIEDIVIPTNLSKPIYQYKKKDAVIRGALYANNYLGCNIVQGRVYMLYVKGIPGYPPTDVITVDDISKIPKNTIIDWDKMLDRCVKSKLEKRFAILGYGFKSRQTTLI